MSSEHLKYVIALQMVPLIGPKSAKSLISFCGSPEAVFKEKKSHLVKIPGIGESMSSKIVKFNNFDKVDKELDFIEKHNIKPLFYWNEEYPKRLIHIEDAPVMLYYNGNADLNAQKIIGIVGTRSATNYGKDFCTKLVKELAEFDVTIISGLAYGIDYCAHKEAVNNNLPTIGVLAHGLDTLYPFQHRDLALKMIENGGLLTEFPTETNPNRENFPKRNRIVAGMVDGLIVVESPKRGGALITAEIAYSYDRELFAVPGRNNDKTSEGCNNLIRIQKANILTEAKDIAYHLGWDMKKRKKVKKKINISSLSEIEKLIVLTIQANEKIHIDKLATLAGQNSSKLPILLLELEFKDFIQPLPGNFYRIKL
ncbi:MAG: DNA-processing protein DprA [Bacteroidota bacterium]|nr:DNA-processing protein DprA [Bacteroidota bacterium]